MKQHETTQNPATGEALSTYTKHTPGEVREVLAASQAAFASWRATPIAARGLCVARLAGLLRARRSELAALMTAEMGKPVLEALAEVDKCAGACEYFAAESERLLVPVEVPSDASRSYVRYDPLGVILTIMPWNFPLWQVIRQAVPTLMAGNVCILKHAHIVWGCAGACEQLFRDAGFPDGVFCSLRIDVEAVGALIGDDAIAGVALTGSERAGRSVAALAGAALKPVVLELGGSDPFVVLGDADIDMAVAGALLSRFLNNGQSCIAAKRLIVVEALAEEFVERLRAGIRALRMGDPRLESTQIGPIARGDLRDTLHAQVQASIAAGAVLLEGGVLPEGPGYFYPPTLLANVRPGMPAFDEELFGPVAAVIVARDANDAFALANNTRFGLGASVWSKSQFTDAVAGTLNAGNVMCNGIVKSDSRLPFGGIRASGLGRELGRAGLIAFTNQKTVWVR